MFWSSPNFGRLEEKQISQTTFQIVLDWGDKKTYLQFSSPMAFFRESFATWNEQVGIGMGLFVS